MPLTRFIDIEQNLDLLANGITFNRGSARDLIAEFLSRNSCGTGGDCGCGPMNITELLSTQTERCEAETTKLHRLPVLQDTATCSSDDEANTARLAESFFRRALTQDLSPADVFRITITSFMDSFNFDLRALMKSCVHHLLPSGHLIPFCAYNNLYRDGHVPLPSLNDVAAREMRAATDRRTTSAT